MNPYRSKKETEGTKPTRFYSSIQEQSVAKNSGGKQTKNSGATQFQKGDVISEDFLFECKTKMDHVQSFTIKKEWLEKNLIESAFMGKKYSALVFNFGPNEKNYYVLDENTFNELTNKE